jgi:hypothetical protein
MHYVIYGRYTDQRRDDGNDWPILAGVHFGGAATTKDAAEQIARDVLNARHYDAHIIINIWESNEPCALYDLMEQAEQRYVRLEVQMEEAHAIVLRNRRWSKAGKKRARAGDLDEEFASALFALGRHQPGDTHARAN